MISGHHVQNLFHFHPFISHQSPLFFLLYTKFLLDRINFPIFLRLGFQQLLSVPLFLLYFLLGEVKLEFRLELLGVCGILFFESEYGGFDILVMLFF